MGCGSSKVQRDSERPATNYGNPRPTRPGTRPGTRPTSQRTKSQGRLATGTGAGNRTRPQSSVPKPQSSAGPRTQSRATGLQSQRQTGSRARASRATHRRHSTALGTIHDGQPPEDSAIRHEINSLRLFIDQHVINFYRTQYEENGVSIARYIARTIISNVIEKHLNENIVAAKIASALERSVNDKTSEKRNEHLLILCRTASMIGDMMDRHPETWEFSWHGGGDIVFPSVLRGQAEFMQATLDV
ncbi:hypothetical protein GX51_05047 [Blastomyces parvus]|uniref:Uncharacterized protein n=1 Tax=Blastomyces parvus TaxID=2060905 RepID=A0A2B7WYW9_9EURO|nr:hypothetical protein GX51_05047 [Blastomyces parvus]